MIEAILSGLIAGAASVLPPLATTGKIKPVQELQRRTPDSLFDVQDHVELSSAAQSAEDPDSSAGGDSKSSPASGTDRTGAALGGSRLTSDQKSQVDELKQRDTEVRQHEAAHQAAAGGYARGGAHFDYQAGPDGNKYVVGGEVDIDTSPVPNNPAATIAKMETVRAAALAPADPSGQDRKVAAEAEAAIQQAQAEQSQNGASAPAAQGRASLAQHLDLMA